MVYSMCRKGNLDRTSLVVLMCLFGCSTSRNPNLVGASSEIQDWSLGLKGVKVSTQHIFEA